MNTNCDLVTLFTVRHTATHTHAGRERNRIRESDTLEHCPVI